MSGMSNLDIELTSLVGQAMENGAKTFEDVKDYVKTNTTYGIIPEAWIRDKLEEYGEEKYEY